MQTIRVAKEKSVTVTGSPIVNNVHSYRAVGYIIHDYIIHAKIVILYISLIYCLLLHVHVYRAVGLHELSRVTLLLHCGHIE
jgi:hypothetical protein